MFQLAEELPNQRDWNDRHRQYKREDGQLLPVIQPTDGPFGLPVRSAVVVSLNSWL